MKVRVFLTLMGVIHFSLFSLADTFEVTKNGVTYLCSPEAASGGGAADCATDAYQGPFSQDQAIQLCTGARSTAPAECAKSAYSGAFNTQQAIALCTGAEDSGPVDCAKAAYTGPFSQAEALQLCSRTGTLETAQCAIRAYAGPYNKDQAIQLCRSNPRLNNIGLTALHLESTNGGFAATLQKSLAKAAAQNELPTK